MTVRVLMLEAPQALLEERARLGLDVRDEMWDGVLHMVPAPQSRHQILESRLIRALGPLADSRGLEIAPEIGLFRPGRDDDWRVPDVAVFRPQVASQRGIEGAAEAVIELRSPGDESYEKISFYLEVGVGEVVLVDRDTLTVEVFRHVGDDRPVAAADTTLRCLDVSFTRMADDHLQLRWDNGSADIEV